MHYIFDFDGTIVDSFEYVLHFLSKEAGHPEPKGAEADKYRRKSMRAMAMMLGIPWWRLPKLFFKGRRVMRARMDNLHAFHGMEHVIKALHADGHKLYLISSNSSRNIRKYLTRQDLKHCFRAIYGGAGILGKMNMIKRLRLRFRIKEKVYYIGDEVNDMASAKAVGAGTVAVTWGFADRKELEDAGPDYIADTPDELITYLKKLQADGTA